MKDCVAGMHFTVDAQFAGIVECCTELSVTVDDGRNAMDHGGIQSALILLDPGDVEFDRDAVRAGNIREIVLEVLPSNPAIFVDFLKDQFFHLVLGA